MEPMTWSKQPEMTLKKGDTATFPGVLVPELNYKNYKTFEITSPQVMKVIEDKGVPVHFEDSPSIFASPILWAIIGGLTGFGIGKALK